jgi:hypothetical protein
LMQETRNVASVLLKPWSALSISNTRRQLQEGMAARNTVLATTK